MSRPPIIYENGTRTPRSTLSPTRRDLSPTNYYQPSTNTNSNGHRSRSPSNPQNLSRPRRQVNHETSSDTSKPLLETDTTNGPQGPPLAGPEVDDLDDRETVASSQPGVDDGFFSTNEGSNPDAENIPPDNRKEPEIPLQPRPHYPSEEPGFNGTDEPDLGRYPVNHPRFPDFPYAPGYGPDVHMNFPEYPGTEFGTDSIPDVNVYQHKKTLAQGMMDLALFSANANQLRYVLESYDRHPYYYPSVALISISLIFQVAVGVGLIWNSRYNVKDKREICIANKINNFTIIGIFLVTVVNVFISAFGVANAPTATTANATPTT